MIIKFNKYSIPVMKLLEVLKPFFFPSSNMCIVCEELCSSGASYAVLHHMMALYLKIICCFSFWFPSLYIKVSVVLSNLCINN